MARCVAFIPRAFHPMGLPGYPRAVACSTVTRAYEWFGVDYTD
jgi:hypothetical protein